MLGLGFFLFARRYLGNTYLFLLLLVLRCFTSQGALLLLAQKIIEVCSMGFPHSEISGSKVALHLPEAYRSNTTSFIATFSQGIHRTPLNFLLRNLKTTILTLHQNKTKLLSLPLGTWNFLLSLAQKTLKSRTGIKFSKCRSSWFYKQKTAFQAVQQTKESLLRKPPFETVVCYIHTD